MYVVTHHTQTLILGNTSQNTGKLVQTFQPPSSVNNWHHRHECINACNAIGLPRCYMCVCPTVSTCRVAILFLTWRTSTASIAKVWFSRMCFMYSVWHYSVNILFCFCSVLWNNLTVLLYECSTEQTKKVLNEIETTCSCFILALVANHVARNLCRMIVQPNRLF